MGGAESRPSVACAAAVDRVFACPVCFEKFTSQVMLCNTGHAICPACRGRVNRCPQCNQSFQGTRNFILEEIISQMQQLKITPENAVRAIANAAQKKTVSQPIPGPSSNNATQAQAPAQSSSASEIVCCRMKNCYMKINVKNLTHHLTSQHSNLIQHLPASGNFRKSDFSMDLNCSGSHRFALVTEMGVFFLIVRVEELFDDPDGDNIQITAWIQGTCADANVTKYFSWIRIDVNGLCAIYHDYVHNNSAKVSDIENKNECLKYKLLADTEEDIVSIEGYISLNNRKTVGPRRTDTKVEYLLDDEEEEEEQEWEDYYTSDSPYYYDSSSSDNEYYYYYD